MRDTLKMEIEISSKIVARFQFMNTDLRTLMVR
jgi:hypothetical protein